AIPTDPANTEYKDPDERDYAFHFRTVPEFGFRRYEGDYIGFRKKAIRVVFSTGLHKKTKKEYFTLLKTTPGKKQVPVDFEMRLMMGNRHRGAVDLYVKGPDINIFKYILLVNKKLRNMYGEKLGENLRLDIFATANSPKPYLSPQPNGNGTLNIYRSGIKNARFSLFKFKEFPLAVMREFGGGTRGLLSASGALSGLVVKQKILTLDGDNGKSGKFAVDMQTEFGSAYGYFGIIEHSCEPARDFGNLDYFDYLIRGGRNLRVFANPALEFIVKSDGRQNLLWMYDTRERRLFKDTEITAYPSGRRGKRTPETFRPASGDLFTWEGGTKRDDIITVREAAQGVFAFCRAGSPGAGGKTSYMKGNVFTERGFYLPGDSVHIGGVMKKMSGLKYVPGALTNPVRLIIDGPGGRVLNTGVKTDRWGGFNFCFAPEKNIQKGSYTLTAQYGNYKCTTTFKIDYFQPNRFDVTIENMAPLMVGGSSKNPVVKGVYLSGNPMA
ncbi:MAG: hypothetical protein GY765_40340, partial [bacterium]|nr:hypothetical protein [bacterium]